MNDDLSPETATSKNTSRRNVLTAAAWSAPVIGLAAATPFASASTCARNLRLSWAVSEASGTIPADNETGTFVRDITFAPQDSTGPAPAAVRARVTHVTSGNARSAFVTTSAGATILARNATRTQVGNGVGNVGGTNEPGYTISQRVSTGTDGIGPVRQGDFQTVTFNFNEDVSNVRFEITDIDRAWTTTANGRDFVDGVTVTAATAAGASVSVTRDPARPNNATIIGDNTVASPFRRSPNNPGNVPEASGEANLALRITGSVRSITI